MVELGGKLYRSDRSITPAYTRRPHAHKCSLDLYHTDPSYGITGVMYITSSGHAPSHAIDWTKFSSRRSEFSAFGGKHNLRSRTVLCTLMHLLVLFSHHIKGPKCTSNKSEQGLVIHTCWKWSFYLLCVLRVIKERQGLCSQPNHHLKLKVPVHIRLSPHYRFSPL